MTGGVSSVVAGIGGLLIGFVCAGFIVCIIDLPAYKMNKMASAVSASADVPKNRNRTKMIRNRHDVHEKSVRKG